METPKPHFVIKNAITPSLIAKFVKLCNNIEPDKLENYSKRKDSDWYAWWCKEKLLPETLLKTVYDSIQKRVEEVTGKLYVTLGTHNSQVTPLKDHIDVNPSDTDIDLDPAYTIIVPLSTSHDCHTVVWNAQYTGKTCKNIYETINIKKEDNNTQEEQELLSHCNKEVFNLGESYFYKWIPGDVICLRRDYVHASDNFIVNDNSASKQSIILITRYIK
jgi:hypothetical protein